MGRERDRVRDREGERERRENNATTFALALCSDKSSIVKNAKKHAGQASLIMGKFKIFFNTALGSKHRIRLCQQI